MNVTSATGRRAGRKIGSVYNGRVGRSRLVQSAGAVFCHFSPSSSPSDRRRRRPVDANCRGCPAASRPLRESGVGLLVPVERSAVPVVLPGRCRVCRRRHRDFRDRWASGSAVPAAPRPLRRRARLSRCRRGDGRSRDRHGRWRLRLPVQDGGAVSRLRVSQSGRPAGDRHLLADAATGGGRRGPGLHSGLRTAPSGARVSGTIRYWERDLATTISLSDGEASWRQVAVGITTDEQGRFSFAVYEGLSYIARASYNIPDDPGHRQAQGTTPPAVISADPAPLRVVLPTPTR